MASSYFQQMMAIIAAGAGGGPPVTITATGTEFLAAASASYRVTAGKLYLQSSVAGNFSAFTFLVKGSDASLTLQNDAAYYDGAVVVSVDGGAYSVAANAGAVYTLYSGLTDAWHKVSIKTGSIWGANNLHLVPAAAVLSVTGVGAGWLAPTSWLHPGDVNALIHTTGALTDNVTDYVPAKVMAEPYLNASNVGTEVKSFDVRLGRYWRANVEVSGTNANIPLVIDVIGQKERV